MLDAIATIARLEAIPIRFLLHPFAIRFPICYSICRTVTPSCQIVKNLVLQGLGAVGFSETARSTMRVQRQKPCFLLATSTLLIIAPFPPLTGLCMAHLATYPFRAAR